jgi:hypothetical protein
MTHDNEKREERNFICGNCRSSFLDAERRGRAQPVPRLWNQRNGMLPLRAS